MHAKWHFLSNENSMENERRKYYQIWKEENAVLNRKLSIIGCDIEEEKHLEKCESRIRSISGSFVMIIDQTQNQRFRFVSSFLGRQSFCEQSHFVGIDHAFSVQKKTIIFPIFSTQKNILPQNQSIRPHSIRTETRKKNLQFRIKFWFSLSIFWLAVRRFLCVAYSSHSFGTLRSIRKDAQEKLHFVECENRFLFSYCTHSFTFCCCFLLMDKTSNWIEFRIPQGRWIQFKQFGTVFFSSLFSFFFFASFFVVPFSFFVYFVISF